MLTGGLPLRPRLLHLFVFTATLAMPAIAADTNASLATDKLAARLKPSVVTVSHAGRAGAREGSGTGFVVGTNLIATCFHVIEEGRAIHVRLADNREVEVEAVHAWDRKRDLAVLRVKAGDLVPLPLGDSDKLPPGAPFLAIGNPMGLAGSVVQGVLSARREMELGEMLQIAIPVEPGNSGGPVLDLQGNVHGIMTMKSVVTANLGFAVPINALKLLLAKPNPTPMTRWLTLGRLNAREWQSAMGATWTQRAGRISASEPGSGFGGRSLCLWQGALPEGTCEMEVTVKLDDEAGAAGLIFGSDGEQKHYGFYPSGGKLRLTRFDGPTVFNWVILKDQPAPGYRAGDWNTLKVRHEKGRVTCHVNGQLTYELEESGLPPGRIGLAKFRDTKAQFRNFRAGKQLADLSPAPVLLAQLQQAVTALEPRAEFDTKTIDRLKTNTVASQSLLRQRADLLDQQARHLRTLADRLHEVTVQQSLLAELSQAEAKINLLHASLLVSRLDNPDVDSAHYQKIVEDMAADIRTALPADANATQRLAAVGRHLFEQSGYHGSRGDYYHRANSYLNEVIDDREGIPITLAVLYMEIGRRLGLDLAGIPVPGHFMVGQLRDKQPVQLIDVYDGAKLLSRDEAQALVRRTGGEPLREEDLAPATKRSIIVRMLRNLISVSNEREPPATVLRYLDTLLLLDPDAAAEHLNRALMLMKLNRNAAAKEDIRWLLERDLPGYNRERLQELFQRL